MVKEIVTYPVLLVCPKCRNKWRYKLDVRLGDASYHVSVTERCPQCKVLGHASISVPTEIDYIEMLNNIGFSGISIKEVEDNVFERIKNISREVMSEKYFNKWMTTANPAFHGSTPIEMISRGNGEDVYRALYRLAEGVTV